jgi:REP element-mobilizing transposase RayT
MGGIEGTRKNSWGGARAGAGRKRASKVFVPHERRPPHSPDHPVHLTLRVQAGLPSLRKKRTFKSIKQSFLRANTTSKLREAFRITHYSVQGNHVHLVAEAADEVSLARGVQGLSVRLARGINNVAGRRGPVFARRYHARALRTGRDVRNVLAYVLLNEQRHLYKTRGLTLGPWYFDPCSSALEFDGWGHINGLDPPPEPQKDVTAPPRCRLLKLLWRRHGLIRPNEVPGT